MLVFWEELGSIIIILPVLSSDIARSCQSNYFWGINSKQKGEKFNLITVLKSQLRTSNIFTVLSIPTLANKSWSLLKLAEEMNPLWALKFLTN